MLAPGGERQALRSAWDQAAGSTGAVALKGDEVSGYVLANPLDSPVFGRGIWIGHAGFATTGPELVRDLYAAAADSWVASGFDHHYVYAPALPELLEPWYRLGFAQMHVEGIRNTAVQDTTLPEGIEIRRGSANDIDRIAVPLNEMIAETQSLSPSFSSVPKRSAGTHADDWRETLGNPSAAYFVAERGSLAIGHSLVYPADSDFGNPVDALYLASTVILPQERRSGIGKMLVDHVLAWAHAEGYGTIITNWRVTNLTASRFWPKAGWHPTFIRLQRVTTIQ